METLKTTAQIDSVCAPAALTSPIVPLFKRKFDDDELEIVIRLLDIESDVPIMYEWVNMQYARQFWQMDGRPLYELRNFYRNIAACDFAQSFMALWKDQPICQLDIYKALQDEVGGLYQAGKGDYGIHLIMAPRQQITTALSTRVLQTFLEYFFSYQEVDRIIGEPDAENHAANKLVLKLGFVYQGKIRMSYKTANFYTCTRESLNAALQAKEILNHNKCV